MSAVGNTVGEHGQCVLRETVVYSPPSTKKEVAKSEVGVVQEVDAQVIKDSRAAEMSSSEDAKTDGTLPTTKVVCQVHEAAVVVAETDHTESDEKGENTDSENEENERDDDSGGHEQGDHDEKSSSEEEDSADDENEGV